MSKRTPLYDAHVALGAQFMEFAHTLLPVRYQSEKEEYFAVRKSVGIFDVSHMGELFVRGKNAQAFLNVVVTNDVSLLSVNQAHYTLLLNDQGGIIDDLIIYRLGQDEFMLCVNANNIENDWLHIKRQSEGMANLDLENRSGDMAQIAVQGRNAEALLRRITDYPMPMRFFITTLEFGPIKAMVARTGYTGEDGFEIFINNADSLPLWHSLIEHGKDFMIKPCGLSARDSLRLEAGLLLHGQDIDEDTSPFEARLMFAVAMNKASFIGKDALLNELQQGAKKKLFGLILQQKGIARHGHKILDSAHQEIGIVTSGGFPPQQPNPIALCYIHSKTQSIGTTVFIDIRGRLIPAQITRPRFTT